MDHPAFFPPHAGLTLAQLVPEIGGELVNPAQHGSVVIHSIAPLGRADVGQLTFINSRKGEEKLVGLKASAIVCRSDLANAVPTEVAVILSPAPQTTFARAGALLHPEAMRPVPTTGGADISPGAHVHPQARLEDGVSVEPGAVIGAGAAIGSGTTVGVGAVVGPGCQIGRNCSIGSHVSLQYALIGNNVILHPGVRIGQDGFGYAPSPSGLLKIPQVGRVIIQDKVEIGANSAVDRGAMDDTVIGEGTKIDNLVQIGHNVHIGRHCVIVGLVAVAGSVNIGDQVMIGGGTTIAGHIKIGAGAQIAGMSAVAGDIPDAARWGGIPARPMRAFLRDMAEIRARAFNRGSDKGDPLDD